MQPLNPTGAIYPTAISGGGGNPGSVDIPTDGQDAVQSSTVGIGFKEIINGLAYFNKLTLGGTNAPASPPNAAPPALAAAYSGPGSGICRIQTYAGSDQAAAATGVNDGDVAVIANSGSALTTAAAGLFYFNALLPQSNANNISIIAVTAASPTGCWVWASFGLINHIYGIAGLNSSGQVAVAQLPVNVDNGIAGLDADGFLKFQPGASNFAQSQSLIVFPSSQPPFQAHWTTDGGSPFGYYKDQTGRVWFQGIMDSAGGATNWAFQLPSGYRPLYDSVFFSNAGGTPVQVGIGGSSGSLGAGKIIFGTSFSAGNNYQLDGISFLATN